MATYILYGGGDLAIEVATYIADICSVVEPSETAPIISDIISTQKPRSADFKTILGYSPKEHQGEANVENVEDKKIIICVGDAILRNKIYMRLKNQNLNLATIIHPSAFVADTAKIGAGTIISPFAFIGPFAKIGENCAINVSAIVGHDAYVGESSVISPGANMNGHSGIGAVSFLGAGSILHPKAQMGSYSKLSSGSVLQNIAGDGFLMHGNPARGRQMIKIPDPDGSEQ